MGRIWSDFTKITASLKATLSGLTVVFFGSLLGVAMVTFLFWAAPKVEAKIFPPVESYEITRVVNSPDRISIYGNFIKNRSCTLESFTVYTAAIDTSITNLPIQFIGQITNPTERPIGKNYFGPWIIEKEYLPPEDPFPLYILLKHECTSLWNTISIFGPFEIKY